MMAEKKQDIIDYINWQKKSSSAPLLSNVVFDKLTDDTTFVDKVIRSGESIGFVIPSKQRRDFFFSAKSREELVELLEKAPADTYTGFFYKAEYEPYRSIMELSDWDEYATYFRISVVYQSNPYEIPLEGRRAILQEMYDPQCGVYPGYDDIDSIMKLVSQEFDSIVDDYYTLEEWKRILDDRECLVCKENGDIITLFVWHIEKNTLYNSMIINHGAANLSYNLERRVFEDAYSAGIRNQYWWTRVDNKQAVERHGKVSKGGAVKNCSVLYNTIYKKR